MKVALRILMPVIVMGLFVKISSGDCHAEIKPSMLPDSLGYKYGKWVDLPINDLVRKGREFLYNKNCPDSAIVCFSIAVSRYKESLSDKEKEDIYKAYTGKWYAQFFYYYDYPKAYESLIEAKKISEELGTGRGMANFNLAVMHQMFGVDDKGNTEHDKVMAYLQDAFRNAIAEKDTSVVHLAFSNMLSSATEKGATERLKPYLQEYESFNKRSLNPMTRFNTLLYFINLSIANEDYEKALSLLDQQVAFISADQPRYLISNLMSRAQIYKRQHRYSEAEEYLKKAEKIAIDGQMKDVLLNIYDARHRLYEQMGDTGKRLDAYHDYLSMKDTLINYRQISGFNQIHFLSEMEKMDDTLARLEYKRQLQVWVTGGCILACIGLLWIVFVILKKNRKLSAANLSLYRKNKELMSKDYLEIQETKTADTAPQKEQDSAAASGLDKEKLDFMMRMIIDAANSAHEIYSPKFTISKFSEIVNLTTKQVSQVINECTGNNFNAFINRYRIKRACQMLEDIDTYGGYTIENIGLNVGFRSRTAFISSFKKVTGLTPSDYLKAAKQAKSKPSLAEKSDDDS